MKYKLVSCDMDDTLLRHDNTIGQRNLDAIHEFERRGGVFMANTGRMHTSVMPRVRELKLIKNSPVSSFQGAMIRESKTDKLLFYKPLGWELGLQVVLDAEKIGMPVQIYDLDDLYCSRSAWKNFSYTRAYAERCAVTPIKVPSVSEYIKKTKIDCVKVIVLGEPEDIARYLKTVGEKYGGALNFNTSTKHLGEMFSKEAGKDVACGVMCAQMGITMGECMAIGDSMNDYNMIKHAGLGVAVANSRREVLDVADYITDSNDNDGVAKAIEKFCL